MGHIILSEDPKFDVKMEAMEVTTPGHCNEWNKRHKQLLENDQYLKKQIDKNPSQENVLNTMEEITANTSGDSIAGALAVKELKASLGDQVRFRLEGTTLYIETVGGVGGEGGTV